MAKLTEKAVADQIGKLRGNVAAVGRAFGVARQSVSEFINRHPKLGELLKDAREAMLDDAESALYRAVINGEGWAVCFFLKTQGKARGYIEKMEVETSGRLEIYEEIVDGDRTSDGPAPPGPG